LASVAQASDRKSVAVIEYRSGSKAFPGLGERIAQALGGAAALDVVGPQEARRRAGAHIDADVAKCAGEAMCVGAIGEQLGVDEVLMVGVSQLGDVVVALQRIDARKGQARARVTDTLAVDTEVGNLVILGWLKQLYPPETFKRYGSIRIYANVEGAEITVNERNVGDTPLADPVRVRAPGNYRVKLMKTGFAPFSAGIDVLPDATVEVRATLTASLGPLPWYKRWWTWAIVGGAIAIAGVGVGVYFGTRVDETPKGFISVPRLSLSF
jgi:hypothetical protein